LLKLTHNLSVDVACKNEIATNFSAQISGKVSVSKLARIWQMLYKGYVDIKAGDVPKLVTEMLLIRICYLADLPTPGELISKYNSSPEGLSLQKDNNQNSNDDIARVLEFFSAEGDMIILQNLRNFANFEQKKEKQITLSYNEKFDEKLIVTIKDKLKKFDANLQIECIKVDANTDHLSIKQKELINLKAHDEMKSLMDSFPEAVISIEK
jgi:DNA polymerase III gamma/tau subunit